MLIKKERKIEHAMYMGSKTIWSKTIGKEKEERRE